MCLVPYSNRHMHGPCTLHGVATGAPTCARSLQTSCQPTGGICQRRLSATYELILPSRWWLCPEVVALNQGFPKECCSWTTAAVFLAKPNSLTTAVSFTQNKHSQVTSLGEPVTKAPSPVVQSTARCGQLMVRASITRGRVSQHCLPPWTCYARRDPQQK